MRKRFLRIISVGIFLLGVLSPYSFSQSSLEDVETAIIHEDYRQAEKIASQMLSSEADTDHKNEARYYLGLCSLRLGEQKKARQIFTDLIDERPKAALRDKAYLGLFEGYYVDGDYEQALLIAQRLLKVSPQSKFLSLVYLKLARANLKLARWDEAREYLTDIRDQFPESLEAYAAKQLLNEKQYFAVQVGAFMDRKRAETLTLELQEKGEYAYIIEAVDRQNRKFFRVRVGQLALLDEAQKLKLKLSKAGYPTQIYP